MMKIIQPPQLWLGCWSNNVANSHPSPGALNSRVLRSCLVPQCSYPPHCHRHQWRIDNCDRVTASYTSGQPSNPRRYPICWASSHWNHTVSRPSWHGAWTPAPFSAHPSIQFRCTAPQIETPISANRTATRQFFWQKQHTCGALGGSSMECGVGGEPHKTPHFNSRHRYPPCRNDPPKALVSGVSAHACTNGVWPPLRLVSVAQKNKQSTMLSCNVRSIDLRMDCTAWRFWTMRQPNGCSTPASKLNKAEQCIKEELAQKKNKKNAKH